MTFQAPEGRQNSGPNLAPKPSVAPSGAESALKTRTQRSRAGLHSVGAPHLLRLTATRITGASAPPIGVEVGVGIGIESHRPSIPIPNPTPSDSFFTPSYSYPYSARRAVLVLAPNTAPPTPQLIHRPEYEHPLHTRRPQFCPLSCPTVGRVSSRAASATARQHGSLRTLAASREVRRVCGFSREAAKPQRTRGSIGAEHRKKVAHGVSRGDRVP